MCLHVSNGELQGQGPDNVEINMDWQHLLMNGEHLPEYAALLASEGPLLGHQHANLAGERSDDDNMGWHDWRSWRHHWSRARACAAAAAGYGEHGERLIDLYPLH